MGILDLESAAKEMRLPHRTWPLIILVPLAIWFALCIRPAHAQAAALSVTTTIVPAKPKPGQGVTVTSKITNTQTPRAALTVTADASWIDTLGVLQTTTSSVSIQVVQPITITALKVTLPVGATYMPNTATVGGFAVVPTQALNVLTIPCNATINETEFVSVLYGLAIP